MTAAARRLPALHTLAGPVAVVMAVPLLFDGYRLTTLTTAAVAFLVALGFNVVFGYAGTISFGHAAFALLGAYTVAIGQVRWDWGHATGAVVATLLCVVVGLVTSLPSLRMAPFAIAVITLLYLSALNSAIQYFDSFTLGGDGVPAMAADLDTEQRWYLVATLGAVAWLACRNLVLSPLGRAWELSRVAPELAESLGVRVTNAKLAAVGIAAGLAGLAGSMWPTLNGFTSPDTFDLNYAIVILVTVVIGGQATIGGPFAGSVVIVAITLYLNEQFTSGGAMASILYAVIVLVVVVAAPGGTVELTHRLVGAAGRRLLPRIGPRSGARRFGARPGAGPGPGPGGGAPDSDDDVATGPLEEVIGATMPATDGATLDIRNVSWVVGGSRILDGIDMVARPGTVHGLIGPNGAGKTSLLNCICGYLEPSTGVVTIDGAPLRGKPSRRSRAGLSRTFQHPALLDHRSVLDNVLPGVDSHRRATYAEYLFRLPRAGRERRRALEEAHRWLDVVGLGGLAGAEAHSLGPGQRRQLEIARALATRPKVLLMDEPAAGLTAVELRVVERVIRTVADRGVAVILIEHHFDLVQRVCDEVTVLDAGAVIFRGTPAEATGDAAVVEAYLGVDPGEDAVEPGRADDDRGTDRGRGDGGAALADVP